MSESWTTSTAVGVTTIIVRTRCIVPCVHTLIRVSLLGILIPAGDQLWLPMHESAACCGEEPVWYNSNYILRHIGHQLQVWEQNRRKHSIRILVFRQLCCGICKNSSHVTRMGPLAFAIGTDGLTQRTVTVSPPRGWYLATKLQPYACQLYEQVWLLLICMCYILSLVGIVHIVGYYFLLRYIPTVLSPMIR